MIQASTQLAEKFVDCYGNEFRSWSNSFVEDYFINLVLKHKIKTTLEIGAFSALFSRRIKQKNKEITSIALEANPYNYEYFKTDVESCGVEYWQAAISDTHGQIDLNLQVQLDEDGNPNKQYFVRGNNSILKRDAVKNYIKCKVPSYTLDDFARVSKLFDTLDLDIALWIDVEGATKQVFSQSSQILAKTKLVYIEVEEKAIWNNQWLSIDVINFFRKLGFFPILRDFERKSQYNIILASDCLNITEEIILANHLFFVELKQKYIEKNNDQKIEKI